MNAGDTMREIIMDSFKLGLGAIDLTREQAEKLVKRLDAIYPDEIKDGRRMVDDLLKQAEKNSKKVQERIEKEVDRAIKAQKLVDEKDLKELAANVRDLAKTTSKLARKTAKKRKKAAKKAAKSPKKKSSKRSAKKSSKKSKGPKAAKR